MAFVSQKSLDLPNDATIDLDMNHYFFCSCHGKGPSDAGTLGYWLGKEHTGQGYMKEAVLTIIDFSFNKLNISRLEAATLPENKSSRGLLERVGFKYEGVGQSYLQINGRWRNHVLYGLLRNDRRGRVKES